MTDPINQEHEDVLNFAHSLPSGLTKEQIYVRIHERAKTAAAATESQPGDERTAFEAWWSEFTDEHDDWRYADSSALRWAAFKAGAALSTPVTPVTPKAIEEITDILLWPVTEDDARAARDMLQSIHFDLSMAEQVAAPVPAAAEGWVKVPAELLRIGELLRTQDNRITDAPMFVVEQKKPVVSDADYNDCRVEWRESENGDYELASPERAARLEALFQAGRDTEGWTRYEMTDVWEFVTACFTEQGCRDYLARNAHNLRETRTYAYGSFRNGEYRAVRNWLMSLPAAPATSDKAEGQSHA